MRRHNPVGKRMGSRIYVHRRYARDVIPPDVWSEARKRLYKGFKYNTVMYDTKDGSVRFDEAPDFDTAREPHVGRTLTVWPDESTPGIGCSMMIWHHKWMWVKDSYRGFDVEESFEWSRKWLAYVQGPASGSPYHWELQIKGLKRNASVEPKEL